VNSPRLAFLICDIPVALIHTHGDYHAIFTRLLQASLDAIPTDKPPTFTLDGFDVTQGIYPPPEAHYDGIIITGSASSVCDDIDWINALIAYTANIITTKPHVKITGICFGHQIVARAMSGQCVHNDSWEVGMTRIGMTHLGQSLFGVETLNINQMHKDHVPALPPGCLLLGSTSTSSIQGMVTFTSGASPSASSPSELLPRVHVLTLQGHPEYTDDMVEAVIVRRLASGALSAQDAAGARARMGQANEGVSVVGRAIWGMFGAKV